MMKKILLGLSIFVGGVFILWIALVFPYPPCTTKQIEVMKQELIDGIIQREIKLRELYAKENGKEFIQTEEFKQRLQKEKEKFYMYCNNDGASEYKNEHCTVSRSMSLWFFERYSSYTLKYHFDEESKVFFNQIATFWGHEKVSSNPTGDKKIWHDRFWIPDREKDKMVFPVRITGYYSEYNFFNCSNSQEHWLRGMKELELASDKAVMKENLLFINSFIPDNKGASSGWGRDIKIGIKTYIQRNKR